MTVNPKAIIERNLDRWHQNVPYLWWPLFLQIGRTSYGWLRLPGDDYRFLSFGLKPDHEERLVGQWGPFSVTRTETLEEQEERLEGEAEDAFMERELNRYTEWYY